MAIAAFDTLATARKLKAAGVEDAQAEAHAEAAAAAVTGGDLATKADLKAGLASLETRLTSRFYGIAAGIVAANTGLTVALLKLLP